MARIRLKYVDEFVDRTGKVRRYFRRPGGKRITLEGEPGSAEFLAAYDAALNDTKPRPVIENRPAGTIDAVIASYYRSQAFIGLAESTKTKNRGVLTRMADRLHPRSRKRYGELPIALMERRHVEELLGLQADTQGAMSETLKVLRLLINHSIMLGLRKTDPTLKMKKAKSTPWRSWTNEEMAQFEAKWPIGTRQRLAYALHLFTGQRRGDVAAMTWRDVAGGRVKVVQQKTGNKVDVRVHRDLAPILAAAAAERKHISILVSEHGRAFSAASYGNWLSDAIDEAGLPEECVIHGLRKTAGRRLAEAGCSAKQIMAILGHSTLQEAERYTRDADIVRLSDAGMAILEGNGNRGGEGRSFPAEADDDD